MTMNLNGNYQLDWKNTKAFFVNRWFRWMLKRNPLSKKVVITLRKSYTLPTKYGFLLLGIVILIGIGAINYQNNLIFVVMFFLIALGIIVLLKTSHNLVGITLSAHPVLPVFCGEYAEFPISLTSDKFHQTIGVGLKGGYHEFIHIHPNAEQRVHIAQTFSKRGLHRLSPLRCHSVYPLGFVEAWSWCFLDQQVLVYPQPVDPAQPIENTFAKQGDTISENITSGVEDFNGLERYQPGDLMSRVDWKSFAREKGLQTKSFIEHQGEPELFDFNAFPNVDVEMRLSYLCYLLLDADKNGRAFGLKLPNKTIHIDQGANHLHRCLKALALF